MCLIEEKDCVRLEFFPSMPEEVSVHQVDGALLGVYKILQEFSANKPINLTLSNRKAKHGIELYKQLFGIPAQIAGVNSLQYQVIISDRALSGTNVDGIVGNNFIIGPLQNMLNREFPQSSFCERCRHILATSMGLNEPTRDQVAQVLNMSVSSLKRRLREEGGFLPKGLIGDAKKLGP